MDCSTEIPEGVLDFTTTVLRIVWQATEAGLSPVYNADGGNILSCISIFLKRHRKLMVEHRMALYFDFSNVYSTQISLMAMLWMEEMASGRGGLLRIYSTSSREQPTSGGLPACSLSGRQRFSNHKRASTLHYGMIHRDPKAKTQIVFENRVLRRISKLKWNRIIGNCRKCHNQVVHNLYSSPDNFRTSN
jgi:hypothetical protein